jgi:hypothetical protein
MAISPHTRQMTKTTNVSPRARIAPESFLICRMTDDPAMMSSRNPAHVQEVRLRNEKSS